EFSGFVLRRMGATLPEAQAAMKIVASYKGSITHPGQEQRLIAIAAGWNNADRQITGKTDVAKTYEQPVTQTGSESVVAENRDEQIVVMRNDAQQNVLADKYILRDVHFNGAQNSDYCITTRYHLVRVANNQLYCVGKVIPIENSNYPFAIADDNDAKLFVDAR